MPNNNRATSEPNKRDITRDKAKEAKRESQQSYRDKESTSLDQLAEKVPGHPTRRYDVLIGARDYIETLENKITAMENELANMKRGFASPEQNYGNYGAGGANMASGMGINGRANPDQYGTYSPSMAVYGGMASQSHITTIEPVQGPNYWSLGGIHQTGSSAPEDPRINLYNPQESYGGQCFPYGGNPPTTTYPEARPSMRRY